MISQRDIQHVELQEAILDQIAMSFTGLDYGSADPHPARVELESAWKGCSALSSGQCHGLQGCDARAWSRSTLASPTDLINVVYAQRNLLAGVKEKWPCLIYQGKGVECQQKQWCFGEGDAASEAMDGGGARR